MPQSVERPCRRCWRAARRRGRGACAAGACRRGAGARSLYKLLIGLGIAGLAVAYQDQAAADGGPRRQRRLEPDRRPGAGHPHHRPHGRGDAVAIDDQGRWIVSAGADGTLKVWNAGSGALVRTIELDEGAATALAVDEQRALTGHKGGAVVLWDLERAEKLAVFQHQEAPISSLAFTGDPNQFVAASQAGAVALFDIRTPAPRRRPLFDGQDGALRRRSPARGRGSLVVGRPGPQHQAVAHRHARPARTWRGQGDVPSALDIAPGGRTVASGSAGGSVRLWSTSSSRPQRTFKAHEGRVTALAFAPQRPPARLRRRGRPGQALGHAQRPRRRACSAATPDRCTRSRSPPMAAA